MKNCPCEQCPCIPICRHRRYVQLVRSCSLWKEYVYYGKDHSMKKHKANFLTWYNTLKPKRWVIDNDDPEYGYIIRTIPEGADRNDAKYQTQI